MKSLKTLDLKKQFKDLYNPSAKSVAVVDVPRFNFIMIDGLVPAHTEVADAPDYQAALETLYGLSYTIKFMVKKRADDPVDYPVMPLEGLWWTKDSHMKSAVTHADPWYFTAMIMQPEPVTMELFERACADLLKKKNPAMLDRARFEAFHEGRAMQIMHIGSFSEEPATIGKLVAFAAENGYKTHGKHHEIYLSDPRRSLPEKLKTVLRHPVR
jgi:hypothetical protein